MVKTLSLMVRLLGLTNMHLHMHLYLNNVETKSQKHEPIVLFRYTDDILFISIHG